jgi:hypothetical protein
MRARKSLKPVILEYNPIIIESPHLKQQANGYYLYLSKRVSDHLNISKTDKTLLLIAEENYVLIIKDPKLIEKYRLQILEAKQTYDRLKNTKQSEETELTSELTSTIVGEVPC